MHNRLHVNWDNRLRVIRDRYGSYAKSGDVLECLSSHYLENGNCGVFLITMGPENAGYDGVMWTINLEVPTDAKAGDVFPIDVWYQQEGMDGDLFTNNKNNDEGKLMQAWFFNKGINSSDNPSTDPYIVKANATFADGYIAIEESAPTTTTTTTPQTTTTTTIDTQTTQAQTSGMDSHYNEKKSLIQ